MMTFHFFTPLARDWLRSGLAGVYEVPLFGCYMVFELIRDGFILLLSMRKNFCLDIKGVPMVNET